jgi:HAD superfamily hydrolase (TIGR01509 family)
MDGLLVDSEPYWEKARRAYTASQGCDWRAEDELGVKGKNSPEWAEAICRRCGLTVQLEEVIVGVVERMEDLYRQDLPLLPGAVDTVRALAQDYPLGLASSSPLELIEDVLTEAGIRSCFQAIASSDEAGRGKPAPDVCLLAARRLGHAPQEIAVFEDSSAGILSGKNADMRVIAVPNLHYPPGQEALDRADLVLPSLTEFTPELLQEMT